MSGTINIVRRVADDDELHGRKREPYVAINARSGDGGQFTAVVRIVAERARQVKEIGESDKA